MIADSKGWRVHVSTNLPVIDTDLAALDRKNVGQINKITTFGLPDGLQKHTTRYFMGDTVPDGTDYPDTIAPIGSVYDRIIVSGAGAVTGAARYMKLASATWTIISPAVQIAGVVTAIKTTTYTIAITDDIVRANTSGAGFTVTLPTAVGYGGKEFVIEVTTGGNILTIEGDGTETINGALNHTSLRQTGDSITLVSDGANWLIKSERISGVTVVEVTVTTGQLLALNATPITMIAAPGAGKYIVPVDVQMFLDYNSAAYDGVAAGEDLVLRYTDGSGGIITTVETTGFLDQAADQHRYVGVAEAAIVPVANAVVVIHLLSGEIATGNSPLKVRIKYKVLDLQV